MDVFGYFNYWVVVVLMMGGKKTEDKVEQIAPEDGVKKDEKVEKEKKEGEKALSAADDKKDGEP